MIVVLDEPFSFWGGFDPATGTIIDVHHPQCGTKLAGQTVLMRESRGSATSSSALAEAIRLSTAPSAIVMVAPDINLVIGAEAASFLYGTSCAVVTVPDETFQRLRNGEQIGIPGIS